MKALLDDGRYHEVPVPVAAPGEALIKILRAGICGTDLEMLQGYKKEEGVVASSMIIIGHEFVGRVESINGAADDDTAIIGKRVVGEINLPCSKCKVCDKPSTSDKLQRKRNHCPNRRCFGIVHHNGAFAPYATLPVENLYVIPDEMPDEVAVFVEPVAAAFRIIETDEISSEDSVAIIGDGKLGCIVARVLASTFSNITVVGKHLHKLAYVADAVHRTVLLEDVINDGSMDSCFDVVIDATGSPSGFKLATELAAPLGKIILKSTCSTLSSKASSNVAAMNAIVVKELRVVGSRCGPFKMAIEWLVGKNTVMQELIQESFPISRIERAIEVAKAPGALKVQVYME